MADYAELYQRAIYYDIAMGRDIRHEVDFIHEFYRQHCGTELRSVLDMGCGPGFHAREFARRGARSVGLDLRPEMIQYARDIDEREGFALEWLVADMRNFSLSAPVDVALNMFDGVDGLLTNDDLLHHLKVVATHLTPGGLYIFDLTHPQYCSPLNYGEHKYTGERNGIQVEVHWATSTPKFSWLTGVADIELEIHVTDSEGTKVFHDQAQERYLMPQEIMLLAQISGVFDVVGWYGAYDMKQPFDDSPKSTLMVVIMQKRGANSHAHRSAEGPIAT